MSATQTEHEDQSRCVLLVDMDCFYVQVEQALRPGHAGRPAAVVQYRPWRGGGIIAINYEARALGVKRGHHGDDALRLCPHIELYRVPERGGKADLGRYRAAGARVLSVLSRFSNTVQRASIDEAFLQLHPTAEQLRQLPSPAQLSNTLVVGYDESYQQQQQQHDPPAENQQSEDDAGKRRRERLSSSVNLFLRSLSQSETDHTRAGDRLLAAGAAMCERIRQAVYDETGYRCSAGVAHNKLMAKVVASLNKPNGQTMLPGSEVGRLLQSMPVRQLRHLGGKLGAAVEQQLGCSTLGQLAALPLALVQQHFDIKTAEWLAQLARGRDPDPVTPQLLPKSIGCGRNFRGPETLRSERRVRQWLQQLCEEIAERLDSDSQLNARSASSLTVTTSDDTGRQMSRSAPLRRHSCQHITDTAFHLISKMRCASDTPAVLATNEGAEDSRGVDSAWHPALTNISICASKFVTISSMRIEDMLAKATSSNSSSTELSLPEVTCNSPATATAHSDGALPTAFGETSSDVETGSGAAADTREKHSCRAQSSPVGFFRQRVAQLKRQRPDTTGSDGGQQLPPTTDACEQESSGAPETTACPRCGEQVSPWTLPEHLDWHVALQLANEPAPVSNPGATASSRGSRRCGRGTANTKSRRHNRTQRGGPSVRGSIDRFFRN